MAQALGPHACLALAHQTRCSGGQHQHIPHMHTPSKRRRRLARMVCLSSPQDDSSSAGGSRLHHSGSGSSSSSSGTFQQLNHLREATRASASSNVQQHTTVQQEPSAPSSPCKLKAVETPYHPVDASQWDLDLMHYKIPMLRFVSPQVVVPLGLTFVLGANIVAGPSIKVTMEAGIPVLLGWFILLRVLPTVFKDFAVQYLETHDFVPDEQPQPQQQVGKPEQRQW